MEGNMHKYRFVVADAMDPENTHKTKWYWNYAEAYNAAHRLAKKYVGAGRDRMTVETKRV